MHQLLKQVGLSMRKLVVNLRISVDLDGHLSLVLVIERFNYLSKTALSQNPEHLKSIQKMVSSLNYVVSFVIVPIRLLGRTQAFVVEYFRHCRKLCQLGHAYLFTLLGNEIGGLDRERLEFCFLRLLTLLGTSFEF